ncbi:PilZ domain-containing protein [Bosea sp. TAF32]|uniref:PilZ domain-containing protein n=1 Tax=Bosea sp. TAF32 TaxID=3237482 RepID=UPI003F904001
MDAERRRAPRQRTLLSGVAAFNGGRSTLDCTIRNLSEAGALMVLSDAVALPQAFEIEIPSRQRQYSARAVWRSGERIGIVFTEPAAAVPLDLMRRLKACETANVGLKARIRQLTEAG